MLAKPQVWITIMRLTVILSNKTATNKSRSFDCNSNNHRSAFPQDKVIILLWSRSTSCLLLIFSGLFIKICTQALAGVAPLVGVLSYKPNYQRFDTRSGHKPGLPVQSPVRASITDSCFCPITSHSLPFSLRPIIIPTGEDLKKKIYTQGSRFNKIAECYCFIKYIVR